MQTKLEKLINEMTKENWRKALSIAAKFPQLGSHKDAIVRGHEAFNHPEFYRQLGHNPDDLINKGIAALRERYAKAYDKANSPSVSETSSANS